MPKQKGTHRIKGSMGELTYYKDGDGNFSVKEKSEISKSRIQTDPAFELTRQNGQEFGRAGKAAKLVRLAFRTLLLNAADGKVHSRLVQRIKKAQNADTDSARGERTITKGDLLLLQGFEFNIKSPLSSVFFGNYSWGIDRNAGVLTVTIPPFVPGSKIVSPPGATHCRIVSGGAVIDFENGTFDNDDQDHFAEVKLDKTATALINLQHSIPPNSNLPVFMLLGIEFYQDMNGTLYSMKNGGFNSLTLFKAEKG
jgi:hypothetical protein